MPDDNTRFLRLLGEMRLKIQDLAEAQTTILETMRVNTKSIGELVEMVERLHTARAVLHESTQENVEKANLKSGRFPT
jgi:hypothetical protein